MIQKLKVCELATIAVMSSLKSLRNSKTIQAIRINGCV